MKFNIYTTGDDFNRYGRPHEKAKYVKTIEMYSSLNSIWEIEFNSLEDLTEFVTGLGVIFGGGVIIKEEENKEVYPHKYTIEIYDDYRE